MHEVFTTNRALHLWPALAAIQGTLQVREVDPKWLTIISPPNENRTDMKKLDWILDISLIFNCVTIAWWKPSQESPFTSRKHNNLMMMLMMLMMMMMMTMISWWRQQRAQGKKRRTRRTRMMRMRKKSNNHLHDSYDSWFMMIISERKSHYIESISNQRCLLSQQPYAASPLHRPCKRSKL